MSQEGEGGGGGGGGGGEGVLSCNSPGEVQMRPIC